MDVCRPQPGVGPEQGANGVDQRVVGDVLADELASSDEVLGIRRQKTERDSVAAPVAPNQDGIKQAAPTNKEDVRRRRWRRHHHYGPAVALGAFAAFAGAIAAHRHHRHYYYGYPGPYYPAYGYYYGPPRYHYYGW